MMMVVEGRGGAFRGGCGKADRRLPKESLHVTVPWFPGLRPLPAALRSGGGGGSEADWGHWAGGDTLPEVPLQRQVATRKRT